MRRRRSIHFSSPSKASGCRGHCQDERRANWRIIFRIEGEDVYDVELIDYH